MPLSGHAFHEIHLHFNWHCLQDAPILTPVLERECHEFLKGYCGRTKGVMFLGVGGTETHVHLAIRIEPFVGIADLIGKLKGACAHALNARHGSGTVKWQRGYGVVSFASKNLPAVLDYIARQKEHHGAAESEGGGLNAVLENGGGGGGYGGEGGGGDDG